MNFWQRSLLLLILCCTWVMRLTPAPLLAQTPSTTTAAPAKGLVKVGSKEFTEQLVLGQMMILLLRNAGYEVEDKTATGGTLAVREALEKGDIDLYPEYTGTAVALFHNVPADALPTDGAGLYQLAQTLDTEQGLTWLEPAPLNNTYTLIVRQELIDQGIVRISDLAAFMNDNDAPLRLCVESEFYARTSDGLLGMQERYGFAFQDDNVLLMDLNETYDNLRNGDCDVAEGFATDGRIAAWGFQNLTDDLHFFPIYNPAPVVRQPLLDSYPEIADLLNELSQHLDDATMSQLNARVDLGADGSFGSGDEETPAEVALRFLQQRKLLPPPTISVGSKDFTEQLLLGKMVVLLLQDAGYPVEDKTGLGGSPLVRAALEKGDIDLYPEYTGLGLALYNSLPAGALPTQPDRLWRLVRSLDVPNGLVWLNHAELNSLSVLLTGPNLASADLTTIADLATYMNDNDAPLTICVDGEFYGNAQNGLAALEQRYGFAFNPENVQLMDLDETYTALRDGDCDIAQGLSSDGRIDTWGLSPLTDPLNFFPIANPAPVVRKAVLDNSPDIADLLNRLSALLDDAAMRELTLQVDLGADGIAASGDEASVEEAAFGFLREKRLLKLPTIAIGAGDYTEQVLLGQMVGLLLANAGYGVTDQTGMSGADTSRQMMETGEIDVYVDYTAQTLTVHHNLPSQALPTDPNQMWRLAKSLDAKKGLIWLDRSSFNHTYTLVVRDDLWEDRQIRSLTDLATYMNENDAPLTICVENDFFAREADGLSRVQELYAFTFKPENVLIGDWDEIYNSVRKGDCDIGEAYSTDGRIAAWDFHTLADPLLVFPIDNAAPVLRQEVLEANPELATVLNGFLPLLDDKTISQLNARIDIGPDGEFNTGDEEEPAAVARDWLVETDLVDPANLPPVLSAPAVETVVPTVTVTPTLSLTTTEPLSDTTTVTPTIAE